MSGQTSRQQWSLYFYETDGGASPVTDFLEGLTKAEWAQCLKHLDTIQKLLTEHQGRLGEPQASHLQGDLWEFRFSIARKKIRILYFVAAPGEVILLHAFMKKTQKTPPKEIDTAFNRMNRHQSTNKSNS